jgi:hypothetical protein
MRFRYSFLLSAAVMVAVISPASSARAQATDEEEREITVDDLTPDQRAQFEQIQRTYHEVERKRRAYKSPANPPQIVRHIRLNKGTRIEPVPQYTPIPTPSALPEAWQKRIEAEVAAEVTAAHTPRPATPLPICMHDRTKKVARATASSVKGKDSTSFDLLVIDQKDLPNDHDEVFGKNTQILVHAPEFARDVTEVTSTLKVSCVPSRVRVTGRNRFLHEGKDALKNYDEDPNGKGKVHELMKGRFR